MAEDLWRTWPVGSRAMVRRRLPAGDSHLFTDVVGDLLAVDDDGVLLRTRRHGDVRVPGSEIAIGKLVPRPRR
ncbi:hypothetical protein [Cellulomonas taurus]|uniref:putative acetyltransferase n=1 Tax=Cellulomonas taurus TaxID=2729175 RepID=UPI00145F2587|nr:hypothetical protein [Cellulomonas taurus]